VVFTPMNVSTSNSFLSVTKLAKVSEPKVLCSGPDDYVSYVVNLKARSVSSTSADGKLLSKYKRCVDIVVKCFDRNSGSVLFSRSWKV
jgi:hypothetical protein